MSQIKCNIYLLKFKFPITGKHNESLLIQLDVCSEMSPEREKAAWLKRKGLLWKRGRDDNKIYCYTQTCLSLQFSQTNMYFCCQINIPWLQILWILSYETQTMIRLEWFNYFFLNNLHWHKACNFITQVIWLLQIRMCAHLWVCVLSFFFFFFVHLGCKAEIIKALMKLYIFSLSSLKLFLLIWSGWSQVTVAADVQQHS